MGRSNGRFASMIEREETLKERNPTKEGRVENASQYQLPHRPPSSPVLQLVLLTLM